jgi:succinate dehydrogenase / fumarate reductase cytochrome b subunit
MNVLLRIWNSSLGKKYLMAISGIALVMFVIGHMVGNLQIFLGPEAINRYAHFLQSNVELLWPVRVIMLSLLCLHIVSALRLWLDNKSARPVEYANGEAPYAAPLTSRMMLVGGVVVACFVVYHILHYTVRVQGINLGAGDFLSLKETLANGETRPDVFAMMIAGFSRPIVSLFYIVGVGALCYHLSHGISAMFQSLGLKNHVYGPLIDKAALVIAIVLFLGYASIPTSVMLGYGKSHLDSKVKSASALSQPVDETKAQLQK